MLFSRKLKRLKPHLWALNRLRYGDIMQRTKDALHALEEKQSAALSNPSTESFEEERIASDIWNHYVAVAVAEQFFKQKSRIHWLQHGDKNTTFFHRTAQANVGRNNIRRLVRADGSVVTSDNEIMEEAISHYQTFLNVQPQDNIGDFLLLENLIDFRCSSAMADSLTRMVTGQEILDVITSMPSNKTPGPDGFTAEFYRKAWPVIGNDLIIAVQSFFLNGFMPHGVNATTLVLVPKKDSASHYKKTPH